jgi:hypothetical protein
MFTKQKYDNDCYASRVKQSTQPLLYRLDANQMASCSPCERGTGSVASRNIYSAAGSVTQAGGVGHIIDVESALLKQATGVSSGCGRDSMYPAPPATGIAEPQCDWMLSPQETLQTHPKPHYRERGNQVERIFQRENEASDFLEPMLPTRGGMDTRQMAKDNYRPRMPRPLGQNPSLPASQHRVGQ